jgi:hypothetical protein
MRTETLRAIGCVLVLLNLLVGIAGITAIIGKEEGWWLRDEPAIDCGPEGKPALGGRACIDREPVVVTKP